MTGYKKFAVIVLIAMGTAACTRHGNNMAADASYNASDEEPDKSNNVAAVDPYKGNNVVDIVDNASNTTTPPDNATTPPQ